MDNENARLRALLRKCRPSVANMAYGWLEDDALVKEIDAALTPAPEAPKDGEGLPGVMPRYFAVQSVTGVHIGMWENGKIASEVLSEYPGGKIIEMVDVHAVPRATPSPGADFKAGLLRAAEIADLNAWAHKGSDDYSQGMDAGARHQVKAICDAIRAEAEKITSSDAGGAHGCAVQTSQPGEVPASASPAPLTLRAGKCYRDGHGEVKGPLHAIWWENGEEMLTDSYVVWHPDGTLAGGTREDKRSLVAEVGDSNA